jgi:hypothetical protein
VAVSKYPMIEYIQANQRQVLIIPVLCIRLNMDLQQLHLIMAIMEQRAFLFTIIPKLLLILLIDRMICVSPNVSTDLRI